MDGFRIVTWQSGDRFVAHIPELSLCVSASSWDAAMGRMRESCEALFREYDEAGLPRPTPRGGVTASGGAEWGAVRLFAAKAAIVAVVAAVMLGGAGLVAGRAAQALASLKPPPAGALVHRAAERIRTAAPEDRAMLRDDLRQIAKELQPIAEMLCPGPSKP